MRRGAIGGWMGLLLLAAVPGRAADPGSGTILENPDDADEPPRDASRLVLPGQADHGDPAAPLPTLPPLWLVPLPDPATRAAERAALDAALQAQFAPAAPPPQRFAVDIVPLAGGQPWQAMQRRIDSSLGP
ncbi:MAG TPA: hypothetical protein VKQ29_08185 [Aliidongia sp.]|nr:hypothetical protein [Aliidongia sp.]